MKKKSAVLVLIFLVFGFMSNAQKNAAKTTQNLSAVGHWFEAPESSSGNTIVFKTTKHILGPNDDPSFAWSEFDLKSNNTFDITYWRWCPSGNYSYNGIWSDLNAGKIKMDFGTNKCKCEMQIISVTATELTVTINETTN